MTTNDTIDVLGLGCTAVDDLLYLDAYPAADSKAPVRDRQRQCGGLTLTALVAAARLGCRCAYTGMLGDDELSQFVVRRLVEEGIDVAHVCPRPDARPVRSTIIVDRGRRTRTILFEVGKTLGADTNWPPEELIRHARVLLVDQFGAEGMIRAARIARAAGPCRGRFRKCGRSAVSGVDGPRGSSHSLPRFRHQANGDQRCAGRCSGALDATTPSGGGDLRQRRLLVY